ncbi:MAG: Ig-like domain-containing protein, partial [Planctomycetes bacterium]|nr:Ig-like domain-containing protein [Planctomycetota bacterium]
RQLHGRGGEGAATGLEPGTYSVLVQPGEWTAVRARAVVERGPPVEVELRVERGVALEGTVRDPAGNPVAGLDVQFTISGDAQSPPQLKAAVTLRDGRFVLKGLLPLPGTLNVSDWAERWDSWTGDALPGSPSLSIVVRRTPSVSGRFEPPPEARRIAYTVVAGDWITGRWDLDLDAEGRFLLPGLEEGLDLSLVFEVPGACLVRRAIAPLVPGEQRDLGTLVVAEGLALRGRAVDEHGEPWALTRVQLTYEDWGIDQYVLTDGMGRFAFENVDPSAQLALTVWSSENAGEYFDLDDWPAKPVHELVVERPR